jgi:hypothetical protein
MPASATVDLAKLVVNESDATAITVDEASATITPYVYDKSSTGATVEAIVPPHTGSGEFAGREFKFTADGRNYIYKLLNDKEFEPGKVYNFEFTLIQTIQSDGMTNCYMVKPNTAVEFLVSRAYVYNGISFTNKLHVDPTGPGYTGEFDVAVVWEDPTGLINTAATVTKVEGAGNTAQVTVKVNNVTAGGNAVVKICKKGETTPVWSYHIWVTDYDPSLPETTWENTNQPAGKYIFMDRNLGATDVSLENAARALASRGLFYQFGRKDPFPGGKAGMAGYAALASSFEGMPGSKATGRKTVSSSDVDGAIIESIQKQTTFFGRVKNYDWLPALKDDLWNMTDNGQYKKTIYDPCPAGWRVPVFSDGTSSNGSDDNSPWKGFTSTPSWNPGDATGGAKFVNDANQEALYPASGSRGGNDGEFYDGGYGGSYWSASVASKFACRLIFIYGGNVYPSDYNSRASGQSVRCVQEKLGP